MNPLHRTVELTRDMLVRDAIPSQPERSSRERVPARQLVAGLFWVLLFSFGFGSAAADCIDYGDYIHWGTPGIQ